jgi:hypothetical protein
VSGEEVKLGDLQRNRLKAEALVNHFENNHKVYLRIKNAIEEKVYATLFNGASLLKLAILQFSQSNCGNSGSNYWLSLLYFLMS